MPVRPSTLPAPEILAVPAAGVVRSRVGMDTATNPEARLKRAKERLYVLCQVGGWGILLLLQLAFAGAVGSASADRLNVIAINVMIFLQGLLLTHYVRVPISRWGWKDLSWRALFPRVLLMALSLSAVWNAIGFGYCYGILQLPWPGKVSIWVVMIASIVQSLFVLIGWLCIYFFYHLFERLNRLQLEQLRMAASVKEAELRALKWQLNPHFLFNSLNSLRALIDEDAPRARESVTRLANMLRYSLQSGQQETVPFEEELRLAEDYLALEQIRHENRLRVRWEIAPEVRLLNVPPMLLQTLVENAVKYGISTRREGGEIVISAGFEGATLAIRVTNPGDLSGPASASAARAGSSTGVGLRNASERLKLLFGAEAGLTLLAEPAGHVTASVTIPLNPADRT